MTEEYAAGRYREACGLLPERLRQTALALEPARQARAEELRLRVGHPLAVTLPEGELPMTEAVVDGGDLERILDKATEYSPYAASETIR